MKSQREYQVAAKAEMIANGSRSIGVLLDLASNGWTIHSGLKFEEVAKSNCTTVDAVRKCAKRHSDLLQLVQDQKRQIIELKQQIASLRSIDSAGIVTKKAIEPWEMNTPEFMAHMRLTWKDPFASDPVGFDARQDDTPLCEFPETPIASSTERI
jgi:hypothetical protein